MDRLPKPSQVVWLSWTDPVGDPVGSWGVRDVLGRWRYHETTGPKTPEFWSVDNTSERIPIKAK